MKSIVYNINFRYGNFQYNFLCNLKSTKPYTSRTFTIKFCMCKHSRKASKSLYKRRFWFSIAHLVVKLFWMDKKIPIESILPYDDPCLDCHTEEQTENYEFRHRLIIRFAFFSFFLIFLGLLLYEILLVPKGYFNGGPWNGKVSPDNPCLFENGKHLRLRLIKDFKSIKNCFN